MRGFSLGTLTHVCQVNWWLIIGPTSECECDWLFVCDGPVMDWWPVQGFPCLLSSGSCDGLQLSRGRSSGYEKWIDLWLACLNGFLLSSFKLISARFFYNPFKYTQVWFFSFSIYFFLVKIKRLNDLAWCNAWEIWTQWNEFHTDSWSATLYSTSCWHSIYSYVVTKVRSVICGCRMIKRNNLKIKEWKRN